jgi:hypothetical protein
MAAGCEHQPAQDSLLAAEAHGLSYAVVAVVAAAKLASGPAAVAEQPQRSHMVSAAVEEVDHVAVEDMLVVPIAGSRQRCIVSWGVRRHLTCCPPGIAPYVPGL